MLYQLLASVWILLKIFKMLQKHWNISRANSLKTHKSRKCLENVFLHLSNIWTIYQYYYFNFSSFNLWFLKITTTERTFNSFIAKSAKIYLVAVCLNDRYSVDSCCCVDDKDFGLLRLFFLNLKTALVQIQVNHLPQFISTRKQSNTMNEPKFPIRIDVWIGFFPEGSNWNDLKFF